MNLVPKTYNGENNLEEFIEECRRFFEVSGTDPNLKGIMVKAFLSRDLIPVYEQVDPNIVEFEEREHFPNLHR